MTEIASVARRRREAAPRRIAREVVEVLDRFPTHTTLPASDLERAKAWYRDKLEMVPKSEDEGGVYYESGGRTFALFPTPYAGTAKNTAMEWSVDDMEAVVAHLKERGVTFDHYDIPGSSGRATSPRWGRSRQPGSRTARTTSCR